MAVLELEPPVKPQGPGDSQGGDGGVNDSRLTTRRGAIEQLSSWVVANALKPVVQSAEWVQEQIITAENRTPVIQARGASLASLNFEVAEPPVPPMDNFPPELEPWVKIAEAAGISAGTAIGSLLLLLRHDNPDASPTQIIQLALNQITNPNRRYFLAMGLPVGAELGLLGCGWLAPSAKAEPPFPTSTQVYPSSPATITRFPPTATSVREMPTKPPHVEIEGPRLATVSVREAVTAFREADKIPADQYNTDRSVTVIGIGGSNPVNLPVVRHDKDTFSFGPASARMKTEFTQDSVKVTPAFDKLTDSANGMLMIGDTRINQAGDALRQYLIEIAQRRGLMQGGEQLQLSAAGSAGVALRGYSVEFNIIPPGDQWLAVPWLTAKDAVANWKVAENGKGMLIRYDFNPPRGDGTGSTDNFAEIPLLDLLVKAKEVSVTVDGRYRIDGKLYANMLRARHVDPNIIRAHDELFRPPIEKGIWSSRQEKEGAATVNYHDAAKAYQFVGSKQDEHAHMLDLTMGTLNVGLMVEEDLIKLPLDAPDPQGNVKRDAKRLTDLKEKYGGAIQNNRKVGNRDMTGIQDRLMEVKRAIINSENEDWQADMEKSNLSNFTVIVDKDGSISQVIRKTGKKDAKGDDILERYALNENGELEIYEVNQKRRAMVQAAKEGSYNGLSMDQLLVQPDSFFEFKRYDDRPLEVREGKFWQGDKEVQLRGAVSVHFRDAAARDNPNTNLTQFKQDVDGIKILGGNYLILHLNLGSDFVGKTTFRNTLLEACKYAKSRGVTVHLAPRAYGWKNGLPDTDSMNKISRDELKAGWNTLLTDDTYAQELGKVVDLITPSAEPSYKTDGKTWMEWPEIKGIFSDIHALYDARTGNSTHLKGYAVPNGAAWINKNVTDSPPSEPTAFIEWHPYQVHMKNLKTTAEAELDKLTSRKIAIIAGEMGYEDTPDFVKNEFKLFNDKRISFAWYPINSALKNPLSLINVNGITEKGYLSSYAFRSGEFS